MNKGQYFRLFSLLSHKERKAFRLFLASPYFNQRPEMVRLCDILEDSAIMDLPIPAKEKIFKKLFSELPYDDLKLRHTFSFFKDLVMRFLSQKEWESEKISVLQCSIRALRKKEDQYFFEKQITKAFQHLENQEYQDPAYHFDRFHLFQEQYEFTHRTKRRGSMYLQEQTDELSKFYISAVLRQACLIQSHISLNSRDYQQHMVDVVIEKVRKGLFLDEPSVAIYYHSYESLKQAEDETHFDALCGLIDLHWTHFRPSEIRDIYILAINYCIRRMNKGDRVFVRRGFDLYQSGLNRKCLLENDQISPFTYKNVLMTGMSLKEFEWVESFLYKYRTHLPKDIRENTFNYNLAIFYFRKPDYDKALELLHTVDFKDTLNNLDARRMMLRIYYEINAFDALESHLESFRQFLIRQKDIGYHAQLYMGLIKAMKRVLRTNLSVRGQREKLIDEVKRSPSFAEKEWLLERIQN